MNNLMVFILSLFLGLFLTGCSTTHNISAYTPLVSLYPTLSEMAKAGRLNVELKNDAKISDRKMVLTNDSLSVLYLNDSVESVIPLSDIRKLSYLNHSKGLGEGIGLGFLVGLGLGVTIGVISGDDEESGFISFDEEPRKPLGLKAEEKALVGGLLLGTLGGVVGAVVGGAGGAPEIFVLPQPSVK